MANFFGSICLTDIPREQITTSEKNGKKYLNIVINERQTPSQFGHTHYIRTKDKKDDKVVYIGELKPSQYDNQQAQAQQQVPQQQEDDDLPF